jgi:hypothetical protein
MDAGPAATARHNTFIDTSRLRQPAIVCVAAMFPLSLPATLQFCLLLSSEKGTATMNLLQGATEVRSTLSKDPQGQLPRRPDLPGRNEQQLSAAG